MLQCSFSFAAAQLLVQMTSALQKSRCCSAVSAAQHSENCSATSVFAMLQGWGLEGWGLGLAEDLSVGVCRQGRREHVGWPLCWDVFSTVQLSCTVAAEQYTSSSCFRFPKDRSSLGRPVLMYEWRLLR